MTKFLRDLLGAEEPLFDIAVDQLEKAAGKPGVDVRLIGDINEKAHQSMRELGLDYKSTTGRELYQALLAHVGKDNERVTKLIGGNDSHDVRQMIPLIVNASKKPKFNRQVWALKRSVAKSLLTKMPPKKLMEHLGYSSIQSMLKNENIDEIYTAIRFSEGAEWLNKYDELFKTITPSDFETREIDVVVMDHDKYVDLAEHFVKKKLHNVTHTKEMGVIVVVPMHQERMKGITLKTLPLIFHYLNEVRLYSAFFKLKQVSKNFGEVVVSTLIADPGNASQMAGQQVHWRVIQRYFGRPSLGDESHPEAFQPHVHPEDLHWRHAEDLLYEVDPEMKFWQDKDYVSLMYDNEPLSLNLIDVAFSFSNSVSYDKRYFYHARESLWNELFMRYMGQKNLEDQILKQLDNDLIAPETLKVS